MAQKQTEPKSEKLEEALNKKISEIGSERAAQEAQKRAAVLNLPFSDLSGVPIDSEALSLLPEETSRAANMAIVSRSAGQLVVAVIDPNAPETKKILDELSNQPLKIKVLITTPAGLARALARYKTITKADVFEVGVIKIDENELDKLQQRINSLSDLRNQISQIPVTKLLEILIAGALKTSASDIHFEPERDKTRLRYRLDGLLHDITLIDNNYYKNVLDRIKVLSKLKLNIHKTPQDGRFTIREKNVSIEVRVSILPSEYGETIVMRLLDPRAIRAELESLGMREDILAQVKEQLAKPNGTLLTTGPTGSGKTTTLYAFINFLNQPDVKIITIEDPIEYHINGISQTQVEPDKDYTFASGLRSIVRQDPDIILVGEIRDLETADIALHAALTGHLVLSTIHTNDASGTIPRLIDLGIKAETIPPAISMAMGQRLVRRLCKECRIKTKLGTEDLARLKSHLEPLQKRFKLPLLTEKLEIFNPGKCAQCNETGYKGRVGVYEVFAMTRALEKLILEQTPSASAIRDTAIAEGMVTMLQDGYMKLLEGQTSLEEIHRVLD